MDWGASICILYCLAKSKWLKNLDWEAFGASVYPSCNYYTNFYDISVWLTSKSFIMSYFNFDGSLDIWLSLVWAIHCLSGTSLTLRSCSNPGVRWITNSATVDLEGSPGKFTEDLEGKPMALWDIYAFYLFLKYCSIIIPSMSLVKIRREINKSNFYGTIWSQANGEAVKPFTAKLWLRLTLPFFWKHFISQWVVCPELSF